MKEVLISVGQAVYDPIKHKSPDEVIPSDTDAGRVLESIFITELHGGANQEARTHARAALRLALALQHKRTADYKTAALCAEAIVSVVDFIGNYNWTPFWGAGQVDNRHSLLTVS